MLEIRLYKVGKFQVKTTIATICVFLSYLHHDGKVIPEAAVATNSLLNNSVFQDSLWRN